MADVVFIAIALGFFALCVLYVEWCDRIIGADDPTVEVPKIADTDTDTEARGGVSA